MVGMDRRAAQAAFSGFLADQSLTPQQIRFVELIIDQLTAKGVMEASAHPKNIFYTGKKSLKTIAAPY